MPSNDKPTFGEALKAARRRRGLPQKEVAARLFELYRTADNYGRIEQGTRTPERDKIITILIKGLEMRDPSDIDRMLALAEFDGLSREEIAQLGLEVAQPLPEVPDPPKPNLTTRTRLWPWLSALLGIAILTWFVSDHALFVSLTGTLYASLFVISVYLESAFETSPVDRSRSTPLLFSIAFLTSVGGLLADERLIATGAVTFALPTAGVLLLSGAVAQFFVARRTLSSVILVPARFQTMTAQTAHLKNTCYFVLLALLFWLPSFHAALSFTRMARGGQQALVQRALTQDLYAGAGVIALSVRVQFLLLLAMFAVSLYMGSKLLDRIRPQSGVNHYTQLFYLRAAVYFLLCLICIGWFAYTTSGPY